MSAVVGDKTSTRRFTVDNEAPPVIASSIPAAGQHLTAKVALDVELSDASGVSGTPVITIDGTSVSEGDSIGEGLAAGDHTLSVTAVDSLGNSANRTVTFTSASIPSSPTDVSTTIGGTANAPTATLSAKLPGEADVPLTATFTAARVITPPASGYQGEAREVPTTLDVAHDGSVDVASLQPIDGRSIETPLDR